LPESKTTTDPIRYRDDDARALLASVADSLRDPDKTCWTQIKKNASRTVYRGTLDGVDCYLKRYHGLSRSHRLRRALGRSDAMREMDFSLYLQNHGVPTAKPLAACFGDGAEWLVTQAVAPAAPLDEWHANRHAENPNDTHNMQPILRATATLIGTMHAAGVCHEDLHSGNILLRTESSDSNAPANPQTPAGVLMDLHRMKRRKRLSRRLRAANLAQLLHDRHFFTTRTERLRFLKTYLDASGAEGSLRGWNYLINQFARRHTRRQYANRDKRILRNNRYFRKVSYPAGWRGHVVLASKRTVPGSQAAQHTFTADQWREILADPDALTTGPDVQVVKDTSSGLVVRRTLTAGDTKLDVYIKRPRFKRRWKQLLSLFRPARTQRAFRLGHILLTRRISTALPLATLEQRRAGVLTDSLLIAEAVDHPHLYDFMKTKLGSTSENNTPDAIRQQRQLAQEVLAQLGRMLRQLHNNRLAHRDLKATNIRIVWQQGRRPEIVLIDLDGLTQMPCLTARRKFQGLMRLNVSLLQCPPVTHAGRLRMLLGYLRRPGSGHIHFKPAWRVLETWSDQKLGQQIRSRQRRQKSERRPT
jgi:tRNA A-37 threonylcarbamoyl transferase component Bud32